MIHDLRQQRTLAHTVTVEGFGYWSGQDILVEFRPAPEDSGIVFVRGDMDPPQRIPALLANRIEIPRRTTLASGGAMVEMVEHIMAALAGLQIDNCEVWASKSEMPGCDGSSQPFVNALLAAGVVLQHAHRSRLVVTERTRVGDADCWVEAQPARQEGLSIAYRLQYGPDTPIGRQRIELPITPVTFCRELAAARTFILREEAEWLRHQGLGARVTCRDLLVFDEHGPKENTLRFDDECVRHKALDLVGDLALAGCDLVGRIVAHRSGHRLNAELVQALLAEAELEEARRRTA